MDKVEYGIKLEQIEKLKSEKQYNEAADIADTIEWRKVKKWSELMTAEEVYEKAERIKEAEEIMEGWIDIDGGKQNVNAAEGAGIGD